MDVGFPLSFGVFQNYYSHLPQFADDPYVSVVGTVASGISYLGAPLVMPLIKRYARWQRQMVWLGCMCLGAHCIVIMLTIVGPFCIGGLVAGSFATTLSGLILTQGITYGIGFLIFYYPIISFINEFWVERRGMVYGILCASSGVSGVVMPYAIEALLNKYGYQTTLRIIAVGLAVLTAPLLPFLKGRLPVMMTESGQSARTSWICLTKPLFWVYCGSNVLQGLGYFFPSLYLPSYASSIGLEPSQGALLLALLSVAQVLGQFSFGYLSDGHLSVNTLIFMSTTMSALAALAIWGLAKSLPVLVVFSLIYGFFGAGYVTLWARMGTALTDEPSAALTTFGLFCFTKGVGNVAAGPISAGLLIPAISKSSYGIMKYKAVIIFTGSCMLGSAVCLGSWYARPVALKRIGRRLRDVYTLCNWMLP